MGASEINERAFMLTHGHGVNNTKKDESIFIGREFLLHSRNVGVFICSKADGGNKYYCPVTDITYDLSTFGVNISSPGVLIVEDMATCGSMFSSGNVYSGCLVIKCSGETAEFTYTNNDDKLRCKDFNKLLQPNIRDGELSEDAVYTLPRELKELKDEAFVFLSVKDAVLSGGRKHMWKYACLAFPNSDELCYEFPSGAVMYLEKDDFKKVYDETNGEAIVILYDLHKVADTDLTLSINEFSYMQLKGQGFNPKWEYYKDEDKYLMHDGNTVVSELFVNHKE